MDKYFQKLVSTAVGGILSYSMISVNSAQATTISYNFSPELSAEYFLAAQNSLKIEEITVINNDIINSQLQVLDEAKIAIQLLSNLSGNNDFELKFVDSQGQINFVSNNIGSWQNKVEKKDSQPFIEPGVLFGLGLISIGGLVRKKNSDN